MLSATSENVQFLAYDDVRIEYRYLRGKRHECPTFVLLHEGLGSMGQWRDFPERLHERTGCSVFIYSRQGYGQSSPVTLPRPLDYLSADGTRELGRVLDSLDLHNVVLLGHSDGASITLSYAAARDPRVLGTVALAPHVVVEAQTLEGIRATTWHWHSGTLRDRLELHHGKNVLSAFHGWSDSWLHPQFSLARIADQLAAITVPLLVIQGRDDQYATLEQLDVIASRVISPCRCVILDHCQHFPHREAADQTLQLISDFLGDLDNTAASDE